MLWHFSVSDPQPQPVPVFQEPIQDVAWSADGNWLAFSSANPPYRLSIVEAACLPECLSTSAIRMIETDTQILNLYWRTPHEITFTTLQANGECNLDGIDIRSRIRSRLMPYNLVQCRALWTSDGSAVYFVNEMPMPGLSIYRWAVGSSQPIQLYQDANTYYLDLMGLSGDETQIFVGVGVPSDIYALNVVSSSLTPLVILPTDDYGASERPW
jgi:Tol biopolymer transport system component